MWSTLLEPFLAVRHMLRRIVSHLAVCVAVFGALRENFMRRGFSVVSTCEIFFRRGISELKLKEIDYIC